MTPDREHLELRPELPPPDFDIVGTEYGPPGTAARDGRVLLAFLFAALSGALVGAFVVWAVMAR